MLLLDDIAAEVSPANKKTQERTFSGLITTLEASSAVSGLVLCSHELQAAGFC